MFPQVQPVVAPDLQIVEPTAARFAPRTATVPAAPQVPTEVMIRSSASIRATPMSTLSLPMPKRVWVALPKCVLPRYRSGSPSTQCPAVTRKRWPEELVAPKPTEHQPPPEALKVILLPGYTSAVGARRSV